MIRLGGVPIKVSIPPILLTKAKGISRRLELIFADIAKLTTIGIINATVPVLLTKPLMTEVVNAINIKILNWLPPASNNNLLLIICAKPVSKIAPPTTNKPIIIMTILLENPVSASSGVRILNRSSESSESSATTSERNLLLTKKITVKRSMTRVMIAPVSIFYLIFRTEIKHYCALRQQKSGKSINSLRFGTLSRSVLKPLFRRLGFDLGVKGMDS